MVIDRSPFEDKLRRILDRPTELTPLSPELYFRGRTWSSRLGNDPSISELAQRYLEKEERAIEEVMSSRKTSSAVSKWLIINGYQPEGLELSKKVRLLELG